MRTQFTLLLFVILNATTSAAEPESSEIQHVVAVEDVCDWPNLTLTGDGEILAILHNQPAHGTQEGGPECGASRDGLAWEKRSVVTQHGPNESCRRHRKER